MLGNLNIPIVLTTGCSQIGKTLYNTFLFCWCIEQGYNALWVYAQERMLNRSVPLQFRPVARKWFPNKALGAQNNTLYQVGKASGIFTYASTSRPTGSRPAAAGSAVVSVSADILFLEERSQYQPGSDAPLFRRLDASRLPTKPVRALGTPGGGQGIEAEIEKADYYFYPHCRCDRCNASVPLNPKICLLSAPLSESGRPLKWYCTDEKNAIATAYFACPSCKSPISDEQRKRSYFVCLHNGITLRDFLEGYTVTDYRTSVGINLSPLLRQAQYNLATEIIRSGLETSNSDDFQQQVLGLPSINSNNSITLDQIKSAIASRKIKVKADFRLSGIDQGRKEDYLMVVDYFLPENWQRLSIAQIGEQAVRQVVYGGIIYRSAIASRLEELGVDYGIIDNEPDIAVAAELCSVTALDMADQVSGFKDDFKLATVKDGGAEYKCWKIRHERYLRAVTLNFATRRVKLPDHWDKWITNRSELSPVRHLMAVSYDPQTGKWQRPKDHVDDLFYAFMFCESAFEIYLSKLISKRFSQSSQWFVG